MHRNWEQNRDGIRIGALVFHEPSGSVGILISERTTPIFREAKARLRLADGAMIEVDHALLKPANEEQRVAFFGHPGLGGFTESGPSHRDEPRI